jgi:hypothetical protein
MLSIIFFALRLSVVMPNVVRLGVAAPIFGRLKINRWTKKYFDFSFLNVHDLKGLLLKTFFICRVAIS